MLRRKALIGIIAAMLGIAAIPAVTYSAPAGQRHGQDAAKSSKARSCGKGKVRKNGKCAKRSPPPEALSATLIVHVYESYGADCKREAAENDECGPSLDEAAPLRISRLGRNRQVVSSIDSKNHTVHVTPGLYEVALAGHIRPEPLRVTVSAGQTVEVTLEIIRF